MSTSSPFLVSPPCLTFSFLYLSEAVLYVLVSTFKFELSDTKIYWNFSGVVYPATSKDTNKPEMWLNVSLAT